MKHILPLLSLLVAGLTACSSCKKENSTEVLPPLPIPTSTAVAPPAPSTPITTSIAVVGGRWQFQIPSDWKKMDASEDGAVDPKLQVRYIKPTEEMMVALWQEELKYKKNSLETFAILNVYMLEVRGAKIKKETSLMVVQDDKQFIYLDVEDGGVQVNTWIGVDDGFGFRFVCVDAFASNKQEECKAIFKTFQFVK